VLRPLSQHRYLFLLVSLLLLLVIPPFVSDRDSGHVLLAGIWSAVLLSAVWGISGNRRLFVVGIALVLPALVADWTFQVTGDRWVAICDLTAALAFIGLTTATLIRAVAGDDSAQGADAIAGAICGYLLLGVVWGLVFCLIELLQPDSFSILHRQQLVAGHAMLSDMLRFSMATITTLGNGNIKPKSPPAEALTALEAITGQLYLAVLIARLVGLHAARSSRR
jgi:voltage-gated potassium channel